MAVNTHSSSPAPPSRLTTPQIIRLSCLWFGLQFFWISQQLIVMPERVKHFVPSEHLGSYYALIKSAGALVVLLMQLSIGYISDHSQSRLGRRRPFILYGMLSGLGAVAFYMLAPGYWWLFAGYMLIEATVDTASIPFQSLLPDLVPEKQHAQAGAQMGLNHLGGNLLGLLVLVAMGVIFKDHTITMLGDTKPAGYVYLLLPSYFVILLLTTLVVVLGVDELRWRQHRDDVDDPGVPRRSMTFLPGITVNYPALAATLLGTIVVTYKRLFVHDLRGHPSFSWLALSRFAVNLGYHTFLAFIAYFTSANLDRQAFLRLLGVPPDKYASYIGMVLPLMLMAFILGGMLGNLLSTPLIARMGKKGVIGAGLVWSGSLFIPLIFTHAVPVAIVLGGALGIGWGAFIAADWAFACTLMPKARAGTFMGVWDVTTLLPQVIAPIIAGPLRDVIVQANHSRLGDAPAEALAYQWVFALVILYFAVGLVLLRPLREAR